MCVRGGVLGEGGNNASDPLFRLFWEISVAVYGT